MKGRIKGRMKGRMKGRRHKCENRRGEEMGVRTEDADMSKKY